MVDEFRWNSWNLDQATKHGCTVEEIQAIVRNPGRGYPRKRGNGKLMVVGRGTGGRLVEVIYVLDEDGTAYVIHAMPLITRRRRGGR
jgi:hypothetical protein